MFAPRGWLQGRGNRAMYRTIEGSGLFDKTFYRRQALTLAEKLSDPIWHYLRVGAARGLNPSPRFDTRFYREWNRDVSAAGVNPFEHYLSYGQEEGRPPVKPLSAWHPGPTSALEPIRFYNSVPAAKPRVTLVLDSSTPLRWPGDTEAFLLATAWVAEGLGRTLRVLRRHGGPSVPDLDLLTLRWPQSVDRPMVTEIPEGIHYSDIEKSPDEIFLASSWSSATVLFQALGGTQLGYLVVEDEAARHPAGEARELASESLSLENVTYISTPEIAQHLGLTKTPGTHLMVTEDALRYGSYVTKLPAVSKDFILVWAGDDLSASHARRALDAVEKTIQSGLLNPDVTPVVMAGGLEHPLLLLGTHHVTPVVAPTARQAQELMSHAYVVCALGGVASEHPVGQFAKELGIPAVTGLSHTLTLESVVKGLTTALKEVSTEAAMSRGSDALAGLETFASHCRARWA